LCFSSNFLIITFAVFAECKNILENSIGLAHSSNITILQPVLKAGSSANTFLPYSGFVISNADKFV